VSRIIGDRRVTPMYWMRDALDTLDVALTYGDSHEPVFGRILASYRELASERDQSDEFERRLQRFLAVKAQPSPGRRPADD